jgi:hypothetical protein
MNKAFIASILLLAAAGATASERRGMQVLEDGREVEAATLTLPAETAGVLQFRGCTACVTVSLNYDETTRYFIGRREVTLSELRFHVSAHPSAAVLLVTPRAKSNTVSRVVAQTIRQQ